MRWIFLAAILAVPTAVEAAEIRVISPGVISNSGLTEVAAAFEKKTGVKVTIQVDGMGTIMGDIRTKDPAADVVMLPMDLMGTMVLSGAVGDFTPLGRAEIGLFKKPDAPRPDITSVPKLIAVMKSASAVLYSDPVSGSMQAGMSDRLLKRADFAGIHGVPVKGVAIAAQSGQHRDRQSLSGGRTARGAGHAYGHGHRHLGPQRGQEERRRLHRLCTVAGGARYLESKGHSPLLNQPGD